MRKRVLHIFATICHVSRVLSPINPDSAKGDDLKIQFFVSKLQKYMFFIMTAFLAASLKQLVGDSTVLLQFLFLEICKLVIICVTLIPTTGH